MIPFTPHTQELCPSFSILKVGYLSQNTRSLPLVLEGGDGGWKMMKSEQVNKILTTLSGEEAKEEKMGDCCYDEVTKSTIEGVSYVIASEYIRGKEVVIEGEPGYNFDFGGALTFQMLDVVMLIGEVGEIWR